MRKKRELKMRVIEVIYMLLCAVLLVFSVLYAVDIIQKPWLLTGIFFTGSLLNLTLSVCMLLVKKHMAAALFFLVLVVCMGATIYFIYF